MNTPPSPHWLAKSVKGRLRWLLIGWMFMVSAVAYLDRVNVSIAGQAIQKDHGLTDVQLGWVFSAFLIGYALFQVPGGWLAARSQPHSRLGSQSTLAGPPHSLSLPPSVWQAR